MSYHFLSGSAEAGHAGSKGLGVFAREPIAAGSVVAGWGGRVCAEVDFGDRADQWEHALQIAEGLFLLPPPELEDADLFNHSCDPNCGMEGNIVLVAMRDVATGEELCFDYAMTDATDYFGFNCSCGTEKCRGVVAGTDWCDPALWDRYQGYFSPYLERRIAKMRSDSGDSPLSLARTRQATRL